MADDGNGSRHFDREQHHLTTSNLISLAIVLFMAFGGGWTLFQSQLANIEKEIASNVSALARAGARQDAELGRINGILRSDLTRDLISRNEFNQFQERFAALKQELTEVEGRQTEIVGRLPHEPIERATVAAVNDAIDKRIDLIQTQIVDINRQIAAALIIIDNNNRAKPGAP